MQETAKGFYKFTDDDEYDVSQFVNQNIDAAEALAFVDKVVPEFPTPTTALIGKRYKKQSTNEVKECGLDEHGQPAWLPIGGGQSTSGNAYKSLNVRQDYLADTEYEHDNIDYEYANQYFKTLDGVTHGRCSQARNGNYVGRNFDWTYDNEYEFFIRTNRNRGRWKSIGMCGSSTIMKADIERGGYNQKYKLLPFLTADGINENHVYIGMNVVPDDMGTTNQTVAGKDDLCSIMIPRMVLDYANSAEHATALIQNYNIYSIPHNEVHFMICDKYKTYIVEFVNNVTKVTDATNFPWLTNFHIEGVEFDSDGKIDWSTVEDHGQGLERYDYIKANIGAADTRDTLLALMRNLDYSKAYSQPNPLGWKTEFTKDDITIHSTDEEFMSVITPARNIFEHRTREEGAYYGTWQTVHTSIYDIDNLTLSIVVQEESNLNLKTYSLEETKEGGGFEPVDVDPIITSRSELGKAIYNKTEDKYKVSNINTPTTYNWDFIEFTSGTEASRPALGYYHATDTGTWWKDNADITDQVREETVEPSEDTNGKLVYFDDLLHRGNKQPETYRFNVIKTGGLGTNDWHYEIEIDNGILSATTGQGVIEYLADCKDFKNTKQYGGLADDSYGDWDKSGLWDILKVVTKTKDEARPNAYLHKHYLTKKSDGVTPSDITTVGNDVFLMIDKFYIWIEGKSYEKLSTGVIIPRKPHIHISNKPLNDLYFASTHRINNSGTPYEAEADYIGMYEASVANTKVYSKSGVLPSGNITVANYLQYAKNRDLERGQEMIDANQHYNLVGLRERNLLWILLMFLTKNKNLRAWCGEGRVKTNNTSGINTGTRNDLGMINGNNNQTDGVRALIENPWGNFHEFGRDGFYCPASSSPLYKWMFTDNPDPSRIDNTFSQYEKQIIIKDKLGYLPTNAQVFPKSYLFENDLHTMSFLSEVGASLSTYMCADWYGLNDDAGNYGVLSFGGAWSNAAVAALLYVADYHLSYSYATYAARLCIL